MHIRNVSLLLIVSSPVGAQSWVVDTASSIGIGSALLVCIVLIYALIVLRRQSTELSKAVPVITEPPNILKQQNVVTGIDPQWLSHPLMAYDAQGQVVLWNHAAERLFGYTSGEILGESASRLTPPWFNDEIQSHRELVQKGAVHGGIETQRLTKAGRLVDVHLQIAPYQVNPDDAIGVICSLFDTTSAHIAQQSLELHSHALAAQPDALVITDAADDNRVIYANMAVQMVTGYNPEELIGRNLRILQGEEQQQDNLEKLRSDLKQGNACQLILRNYRKDGTLFWNELSITPLRNEAGRLVYYLGIMRDVSEQMSSTESLRQNVTRWRELFDLAPVGALVCDAQGRIDSVNREICRMLSKKPEQLLGRSFSELHMTPDLEESSFANRGEIVLEREGMPPITVRISRNAFQLKGSEQQQALFITDVTDKRRKERSLHQEQERVHSALASMGDAVITINTRGVIDYINPSAEILTGWRNDEAQGQPASLVFNVIHERTREPVADPVRRCLSLGRRVRLPLGTLLVSKCGHELAIQASAAPIYGPKQQVLGSVLVMQDISETHRRVKEATEQAARDPLTGLINRREMEHQLQELLDSVRDEHKQHSLCMLDLDHFKPVNDQCGHGAGDEVLRQIARLLQEQLRGSDTVARIGGDEFALLLRGCSPQKALEIATTACQAISRYRYRWRGREFALGASIGLVSLDQPGISLEQALKAADAACYQAKSEGRGRVNQYNPNKGQGPVREPEAGWVQRIAHAIENDGMELMVQTITSLTRKVSHPLWRISMRYRGENGKTTEPNVFLPVLERYRALTELDRWLVAETLDALEKRLSEKGIYILGLTGHSLEDPSFANFLLERLNRSTLDPHKLCFEVREYDLARLPGTGGALLEKLRSKGCRICLADFTNGLNLLSQLRGEQFDYIRWSDGISAALEDGPIGEAVVGGLNQISHVAGACTIATGVNDDVTLARMRNLQVDFAEGRAVGRPCELSSEVWVKERALE